MTATRIGPSSINVIIIIAINVLLDERWWKIDEEQKLVFDFFRLTYVVKLELDPILTIYLCAKNSVLLELLSSNSVVLIYNFYYLYDFCLKHCSNENSVYIISYCIVIAVWFNCILHKHLAVNL